jgi:hypothetical protein
MESETMAQRVFERRGYLVISSSTDCAVGDVLSDVDWAIDHSDNDVRETKLVVIAETTEQDHIDQALMAGVSRWKNPDPLQQSRYYRVVAE